MCLKETLYDGDVTGQQTAHLPSLRQGLPKGFYTVLDVGSAQQYLAAAHSNYVPEVLKDSLQAKNNQLASVRQICSNQSSQKVLLIAWLLFAAICLAIVGVYAFKHYQQSHFSAVNLACGFRDLVCWPFTTMT